MNKKKTPSAKESTKRMKKKEVFSSSEEDSIIEEPNNIENTESPDKSKEMLENLSSMTEEEMAQHLKLCMKLSVENKINMKNAFGLHLIEIMQKTVKNSERADIQQASLSLQASSKIYAGRVESLYQDTCKFHGHLQSIISGGKIDKKIKDADNVMDDLDDDGASQTGKKKLQKSKCKCFLKPEESLNIDQDTIALSRGEPHGNFTTINSTFSTSRLAPKLISSLQLVNDLCILKCAAPEPCFKPRTPVISTTFNVSSKFEVLTEKIRKFDVSQSQFQALLATSNQLSSLNVSTPKDKFQSPSLLFDDNDEFVAPTPSNFSFVTKHKISEDVVESATEKLDVLNITANAFVNDIAAAVTDQGFDQNLLPPGSTLKKMLDRSQRRSIKTPTTTGKSTKRKLKEPFYAGKSVNDIKHLFTKGRSTCISQKNLSEWAIENTTDIDIGYEFIEKFETRKEEELDCNATLEEVLDILKQNDLQYNFKYYFNKQFQMWKLTRKRISLDDSFSGARFANQTEKRLGSLSTGAPDNPESLAVSFQNLSIHDSVHEEPADTGGNASDKETAGVDYEDQQFGDLPEPFDIDIEELMVKPPELVRPARMKYDSRPTNLNTESIKELLWKIISKHVETNGNSEKYTKSFALFSEVYEELKIKLEKDVSEYISMQFAFVVLLILANEKTLLIENVKENTDLSIKQDTSEIEVSENM